MAENREFFIPPCLRRPLRGGGFPSEYRHPVWHGKTRMSWLLDGEKNSKISLFVLTQLTNVTDRQTDRHRMPAIAALMHSIARQKLTDILTIQHAMNNNLSNYMVVHCINFLANITALRSQACVVFLGLQSRVTSRPKNLHTPYSSV